MSSWEENGLDYAPNRSRATWAPR